jgi:alpha-galactosidase
MKSCGLSVLGVIMLAASGGVWGAVKVMPDEMAMARSWSAKTLSASNVPFSFVYDGKSSRELLRNWSDRKTQWIDGQRTRRTTIYSDPQMGLEVRWEVVEYRDFPTVEWTVYFKNTGKADTPILSDIRALDARFERGGEPEFVLHHQKGTFVRADDYEPLTTTLGPDAKLDFAPPGGRPCGAVFPYFNFAWGG